MATTHRYKTTPNLTKLVSQLRIRIQPGHRLIRNRDGPPGRIKKLSQIVTGLLKYERLELNYTKADEARGYVERLISEAIRHGDCHTPTMEMADRWITEKQVIHKLFKVLAPRYQNSPLSYTKLYRAPKLFTQDPYPKSILELRGNPYPPLVPNLSHNRNLIHNVLLEEAKKEYRARKYAEMSEKLASADLAASATESEKSTLSQNQENLKAETASPLEKSPGLVEEAVDQNEGKSPEPEILEKPLGEPKSS
nr:PREDICTED: 39S ribosomal protein L17, mitochondrial [Bemisia tabaci]